MQNTITKDRLRQLKGKPVFDNAGQKIGGIEDIYLDDRTDQPEWIGLGTGMFGMKHIVVPLQEAQLDGDSIRVPYSKDKVKDAPDVGTEDHVDETKEAELYRYYGVRPDYAPGDESGRFEQGHGTAEQTAGGPKTGDAKMTRSEEELKIGKRQVPAGQVRLRKWVETEPVSEDVELRRERVSVERVPADRPLDSTDEIGEDEVTMNLMREEPVVEKTARVKEEIGLNKDEESRTERVTGEVRKERVDTDDKMKRT
jgi:uncharacterized protein (TIGR02271 family)